MYTLLLDDDSEYRGRRVWTSSSGYPMILHNGRNTMLHSVILGKQEGHLGEHVDRNKWNAQRSNLRHATERQNHWNVGLRGLNKTGLIGVSKSKEGKPWRAQIRDNNGRAINLGRYDTMKEAEIARDMACYNMRGEFAVLNNVDNLMKNRLCIS